MTQPHPFRRALEGGDVKAMVAALSADIVFHGPVVQRPIVGRAQVSRLLELLGRDDPRGNVRAAGSARPLGLDRNVEASEVGR